MDRFLKTGWQSWSWEDGKSFIKLPTCNYSPKGGSSWATSAKIAPTQKLKSPINGWCSWYAFGTNINEQKINKNIDWLAANGFSKFNHILIDDGWEFYWGDWLSADSTKFPSGLAYFAKSISDKNFVPGIWVAPFLASPNSVLFKSHPDWFVRSGNAFVDGMRLTPFDIYFKHKKYILDIKNLDVLSYLDRVFAYLIEDCKFKFIKLDFLYALHFDPSLNKDEADLFLKNFLYKIKTKYPDVYTIACGCPLLPAVENVDSMRIGPDINIPSLINVPFVGHITSKFLYKKVIKNLQSRMWTRVFWNLDPDVLLISDKVHLNDSEILRLKAAVLECGGNLFLGDDLTKLPAVRVEKFLSDLR